MTPRADVCLHSLKGVLQQMLGERGLSISMSEALSMALLDPAQLEKTVLHLAQNAAETVGADWHMAIEIAPACVPGTAAGEPEWGRIRLVHNGNGMAEDVQRRAFDPFFTTKTDGQRAGLGLSLCSASSSKVASTSSWGASG